jgi:hypothetical protein
MGLEVSWVDYAQTTILRYFTGHWTWEEFYKSQEQVNAMLRSVPHQVHQILDFSETSSLPPNTLTHLRNSARNVPPNRGKSIVVTRSNFYLQMYNILNKLFPAITERVIIVATREEALEKARGTADRTHPRR